MLVAAVLAPAPAGASRTLPRATAPDLERLPALELAGADAAGVAQAEPLPLYTFVDVVALDRVAGQPDDQLEAAVGRQRHRLHLVSSELARPGEPVWGSKTATGVSTWLDADKHLEGRELGPKSLRPSFQGLWTDPVSGLSYARNRWYDARSASWLSEDPMGAVDSVNLYAFVGWGPQAGTDPMGLESFGEFVESYTEEAFEDGGFWNKAAATGLTFLDATFQVVTVGATKKIDAAQEQLDRGQITSGQYWKKTTVAVAQTAATYAGGAGAGTLGARAGVRVLGSRGVTAVGVRAAGAIGGAAGGAGGTLSGDLVGIAAGEQEGLSSGETYIVSALVGGGIGAAGAIPQRLPQDVNVNPQAPRALSTHRPVGRPSHNVAVQQEIQTARAAGARDLRVNQQQLTAAADGAPGGTRAGVNRPDLQYTNAAGRRVHVEYDAPPAGRAVNHALRLLSNDPRSIVYLFTIP